MKKVTYFDLGVWQGQEIDVFIEIAKELDLEYRVFGFEANPILCRELFTKYQDNKNVSIIHAAIAEKFGICKLYYSPPDGIGSSIFETKNNIEKDNFFHVLSVNLSSILNLDVLGDINIIRFNIEGAELYLMQDLIRTGKHKHIDLFFGSTPDIEKVSEIKHLIGYYKNLLIDHSIHVSEFYYDGDPEKQMKFRKNITDSIKQLLP